MKLLAGASVLMLLASGLVAHAGEPRARPPQIDALALAARLDQMIEHRWRERNIIPAPLADDAEFFRRISLDIAGRIPRPSEVHAFLDDPAPDKRRRAIERLLESPRYVQHFANVWRALLLSEIAANPQARFFQQGFEAWLKDKLRANVGYDQMVRELMTTPIASTSGAGQYVLSRPDQPNPIAFFAVKDGSPEKIAAAATRLFLGVQLECAQCHDHPFARWRRDQFWNQAAFFSGVKRQGEGLFQPLTEDRSKHAISISGTEKVVEAVFLDETMPKWTPGDSLREALALWLTASENELFSRALVNRLWSRLFGTGLVEPVDDFHEQNPPSHPEVLDLLAHSFAASGFDLRYLIRALCNTRAYQLTSAVGHPSQNEPRVFARMALKELSGEQFFDSLALAVGHRESDADRGSFQSGRGSARGDLLARFASTGGKADGQTSVLQALTLMNGRFVAGVLDPAGSNNLAAILEMPGSDTGQRIASLYFLCLGRSPTTEEQARLTAYVGAEREKERLADVFWALLNSAEFRFNH